MAADNLQAMHLNLDVADVKQQLRAPSPTTTSAAVEAEAPSVELAKQYVTADHDDATVRQAILAEVTALGREVQAEAATRSRRLQAPVRELMARSEDDGSVAQALVALRAEVDKLDPSTVEENPGFASRLASRLSGSGTPMQQYFLRYENAQSGIDAIIKSLEDGRRRLERDNVTLRADQADMQRLADSLSEQIAPAQALDDALSFQTELELPFGDTGRQFLEDEVLHTLRQRSTDLQQQLAVNQQGLLATELVVRNNRELIRGVNRALDATIGALQVAITVALGLTQQKMAINKIEALNDTTSGLMDATSAQLRIEGASLNQRASSATLDMVSLQTAFDDVNATLDEINRYRHDALPLMADVVLELDVLATQSAEAATKFNRERPDGRSDMAAGEGT